MGRIWASNRSSMHTLRQYLTTLSDTHALTRTLGEIDVCRDRQGRMCYSAGNSAAVFRIRHAGRIRSLRCYFYPPRHTAEIYGENFLPQELYLYTAPDAGVWVDVVLGEWVEGCTLQEATEAAATEGDTVKLQCLADAFDRLAAKMLTADWAHGDLKPDNIIVDPAGALHLIDFDMLFLSQFAGEPNPGIGTAAFQHPARGVTDFDASLDDYPIALISTALHALALEPQLYTRYATADGLLFTPAAIHTDTALKEALALFERKGMALQYRIGRLLYAPTIRLAGIADLFAWAVRPPAVMDDVLPELFVENGFWGYRIGSRMVIPPVYDSGFDFSEGLAAVQIGTAWHFIDPAGNVRIHCPGCEAIKPFRSGRAQVIRNGQRIQIDKQGLAIGD